MTELPNACDAHIHIFEPAERSYADVAAYRLVQKQLGTQRTVIVQPRAYGTDHRVTLQAIAQLGSGNARGVGVLTPEVNHHQLLELNDGGIKGIRFTLYTPVNAVTSFDMVLPLAKRIAPLGWHVQLHWTADQIVAREALLESLPTTMVFDHFARLHTAHRAFSIVSRLVEQGRAWVKLSAPYLDGRSEDFNDIDAIAKAWIQACPERLVWGSDWPHTTETQAPVTHKLLGLLTRWTSGSAHQTQLLQRILVDNPSELYGFIHESNP